MRFDARIIRAALHPTWVGLVLLATFLAAAGGLWVGIQQPVGETSTSFVFARRVGFLDRPPPSLDDHLNEIINSVEFPEVFIRIEDRLLLEADRDYDLAIGQVDNTQSLVAIDIETGRTGESDRISRIVAEEMVSFVLTNQNATIGSEITDLADEIVRLEGEQVRLTALAGGVPPNQLANRVETELAGLVSGRLVASRPEVETVLRDQLATVSPLASEFNQNARSLRTLQTQHAQTRLERLDITSGLTSINEEWYRAITPPEPTSNVPVTIAIAFAAAVPAFIAASLLVILNVARRLARADQLAERERAQSATISRPVVSV